MDQTGILVVGGLFVVGLIAYAMRDSIKNGIRPTPNPNLVCPHCQTRGTVTATHAIRKRGISGGKATGALFTGGVSMLATGLSRKQGVTQMVCGQCGVRWDVN